MTDYIGVFFIVLSCISIPHIISMNSFYARISKNGADIGNEPWFYSYYLEKKCPKNFRSEIL